MGSLCSEAGLAVVEVMRWRSGPDGNDLVDMAPADARSSRRLACGPAVLWVRHFGELTPVNGRVVHVNTDLCATLRVERTGW